MAEFVEIMNQMKRMCHSTYCSVCPIHKDKSVCDYCGEYQMLREVNYKRLCEIVMQWTKEHPEVKEET